MAKKWTEEEVTRLKELTEADLPDKEIAEKITAEFDYERTEYAVQSKRLDLGLKKIDTNNQDKKQDENKNNNKSRIVFNTKNIKQIIDKVKNNKWTENNILALNYLTSQGVSDERIAELIDKKLEEVKRKRNKIKQIIKKAG